MAEEDIEEKKEGCVHRYTGQSTNNVRYMQTKLDDGMGRATHTRLAQRVCFLFLGLRQSITIDRYKMYVYNLVVPFWL